MVLLEAIAGAAPLSAVGDETGPTWAGKGLCELAALHASFREQGAAGVIGAAESRSGKTGSSRAPRDPRALPGPEFERSLPTRA